jgi:hypothetical protein
MKLAFALRTTTLPATAPTSGSLNGVQACSKA